MSFQDVVRFLSSRDSHPAAAAPVEVVETHAAMVFLTGRDAYKIKRPVKYDYLDFSTLAKRRAMLGRELALNRPAAPELYLGLVPITRGADGRLALGGTGEVVEWCLHMRRFPKEAELSELASRGALSEKIAADIGRTLADYHHRAERRDADGHRQVARIAAGLESAFSDMSDVLEPGRAARFGAAVSRQIETNAALLSERDRLGHVRRGHGDLHLGNLVLIDGRPVPFDALEFDEDLATLDVLYDLAFLLMDLSHQGMGWAANAALNAYLETADLPDHLDGLALLPLFTGLRAGIRAMVSVQAAQLADNGGEAKQDAARAYLDQALTLLAPPPPRLVAVGGLSGTGKTTLARRLAPAIGPAPGAIHLRSDVERKALFGVDALTRLPPSAYDGATGETVYARLLDKADRILAAGHGVVLDAVFLRAEERAAVARLARRHGVAATGLWLEADVQTLLARVGARRGDASDADAGVVRAQVAAAGAVPDWPHVDAGASGAETLRRAAGLCPLDRPLSLPPAQG